MREQGELEVRSSRFWLVDVSGVAIAVSILAVLNPNWVSTPAGVVDPWIYLNYWQDFGNFAGEGWWPSDYKASRLPWLVIGNLGWNILGPETFQYVLVITSVTFAAALGYWICTSLELHSRLLCGALLAFLPVLHGLGGWFYQNTPGVLLQLAVIGVLGAVVRCSHQPFDQILKRRLFLAGVLIALLVVTDLLRSLSILPYLLAAVTLVKLESPVAKSRVSRLIPMSFILIVGAFTTLVLLVPIAVLGNMRPDYWSPMIRALGHYGTDGYSRWWEPLDSGWFWNADYLAIPTLSFLIAVIQLGRRKTRGLFLHPEVLFLLLGHIGTSVIWSCAHSFMRVPFLNAEIHAQPLVITGITVLAASTSRNFRVNADRQGSDQLTRVETYSRLLFSVVPLLILIAPNQSSDQIVKFAKSAVGGGFNLELLALVAGGLFWLKLMKKKRFSTRTTCIVGALALAPVFAVQDRIGYSAFTDCHQISRENQVVIRLSNDFITHSVNDGVIFPVHVSDPANRGSEECVIRIPRITQSLSVISPFYYQPTKVDELSGLREIIDTRYPQNLLLLFDEMPIDKTTRIVREIKAIFPQSRVASCNGDIRTESEIAYFCVSIRP